MTTATPLIAPLTAQPQSVYADILSQAVSGELVGMANYAAMVELCDDPVEQEDAVAHAQSERGHANAFRRVAADLGVPVIVDPDAHYWGRIRRVFLDEVRGGDLSSCLIVQELMLESFAVSMYDAVADADAIDDRMRRAFRAIAREEEGHLQHAIDELAPERDRDPVAFTAKVARLHDRVMTILAEMVAAQDTDGACGLCAHTCVKQSLHCVGLSAGELRGRALNYYLRVLDRMGIPGDQSLRWVANLPA